MTRARLKKVLSNTLVVMVVLLCVAAAALMLTLPTDSLKVDAVYQKF